MSTHFRHVLFFNSKVPFRCKVSAFSCLVCPPTERLSKSQGFFQQHCRVRTCVSNGATSRDVQFIHRYM